MTEYLAFLYLCGLALALRLREVINTFPDITKLSFDYEDVIFILSRLSNSNEMSRVKCLSLPLISLCFLIACEQQDRKSVVTPRL